jgi:hypothetical protein
LREIGHARGLLARGASHGFGDDRLGGNRVEASHLRPDLGFARFAFGGSAQQDEPRREALLIELDAVIGAPCGFGTQDAGM